MDAITGIDGVETVGAMSGGSDSTSNMLMMSGTEARRTTPALPIMFC